MPSAQLSCRAACLCIFSVCKVLERNASGECWRSHNESHNITVHQSVSHSVSQSVSRSVSQSIIQGHTVKCHHHYHLQFYIHTRAHTLTCTCTRTHTHMRTHTHTLGSRGGAHPCYCFHAIILFHAYVNSGPLAGLVTGGVSGLAMHRTYILLIINIILTGLKLSVKG